MAFRKNPLVLIFPSLFIVALVLLLPGAQAIAQITEFKKILPVEFAENFRYGSKISFAGGLGVVSTTAPCTTATGFSSSACGRAYVVKRDFNGKWSLLNYFQRPPALVNESEIRNAAVIATDGSYFAVGRMSGAQGMYMPTIDVYQVNGSGQIFFRKEINYQFGGDFSPESSTSVEYPIAMASGFLAAGSPNDPNRNPLNGDVISSGRILVYSNNTGGSNNWGLLKTLVAPAPFGSSYGSAVAASPSYIVAGAPIINSIYLYSKDLGGVNNWGLVKEISPADKAAGDSFGRAIAVSGDIIAVGAPNDDDRGTDSGSVYIFGKDQGGVNNWGLVKKIVASDGVAGDQFGISISLVNNDLVVGAPQDDDNGSNSGSVYHFSKDNGGTNNWGQISKLKKTAGTYTEDRFGAAVAIDNDELFTGIPFDDMQGTNSGAVALYKKTGSIFGYQNQWSASNVTRGANFGYSLDFNGGLAVFNNDFIFSKDFPTTNNWGLVRGENTELPMAECYNQLHVDLEGDYAFRANGQACLEVEEGSVVVMYKDQGGANKWGDIKTITPTSATPYGVFGWKSAAFQDILVANAYKNVNGFSGQQTGDTKGEVYIFGKDIGGLNNWGQIKKLTATNAQVGDYFGFDLAVQNNVLAIAAPGITSNKGAVFIHYQNQGGSNNWGLLKRIDTPDGGANDEFGKSIYLLNGTDLVISAPGNSTNAGAVYLFKKDQGGADNWGFVKKITSPVVKPAGKFGTKVSLSSEGLIVSDADRELFVFLTNEGGNGNFGYVNKLLSTDFSVSDAFGASFTISGNVVLVGAPAQTNGLGSKVGAAYLFYTPPPSPVVNSATAITNSSFSISWNAVSNVTGYKVDVSTASNFSSFVSGFNGLITTQTNVALSGLNPNQNYFVRVRSIRTLGGESKVSNVVTALTAPAVPTANSATLIEATSFTANWTTITGATSYQVELLNADDTPVSGFPKLVNTVGTSITGLTSGRVYKYRIRSSNGSLSAQSNQITVLLKPGPPVALNALNIIAGGFKAVWNATTGATSYELDVATDVGFINLLTGYNAKPITLTEETLSNLAIPQTNYWYRVRAVNASGKSTNSNIINLTTPAGIPLSFSAPEIVNGKIKITLQGASGTPVVKFHSRGIAETNFTEETVGAPVTVDPLVYEMTIDASDFDELGLQYYFSATDVATVTPVESTQNYIYSLISLESVPAIPFSAKLNGKANTYEMFSVPYVLEDKSIASTFDEMGGSDKTKWRLFRYQGGRYLEYPDNITNIDLGRGYWFNSIENVVNKIKTGEGEVARANQSTPFTLTFERGWNQIGNPYPFNIDWDAVVDANPSSGLNSLWLFENGNYVKKDVLATWKGAFVFSDNGGQVSFPVSAKTTSAGRSKSNALSQNPDDPSWQFPIMLSLNDLSQISSIGMHPEASISKDKYDEITRPRFLNYLEMNSYHADFFAPNFSDDIVPVAQAYTWEFQVSSSQKSGTATLSWNQQGLMGSQSQIALLDIDRQNLVDMKKVNTYQFSWKEGNRFRILYSKTGELQPCIDLLGNAYPNPFQAGVTIPFFLERDQHRIEVTLYDMLGRKIKSIGLHNVKAGIHNLDWDGKNEQGSAAESGMYLYQLTGDNGIITSPKRLVKQ